MSASGFTKKRIDLTITLATGASSFDGTASNTVKLSGLRMMADMVGYGGESMNMLQLRVFGLPQSIMNQLTVIGTINRVNPANKIILEAGDADGVQLVFAGTITEAWADYNSAPDVAFNVIAYAGLDALMKPVTPSSYGAPSADVVGIMGDLAKLMGLAFEPNDVKAKLNYPYFSGTALSQVRACARAAAIFYVIDKGTLAIWSSDNGRAGEVPLISAQSGMVGYPTVSSKNLAVKTVFNWNIRVGGFVQLQSSIPMATGKFLVVDFAHSLSSELPGGPWFTTFKCVYVPK
jgi:uncharacterized membrane protein